MEEETSSCEDWLFTLLKEEELIQYYDKIKDDLQIKRLAVSGSFIDNNYLLLATNYSLISILIA